MFLDNGEAKLRLLLIVFKNFIFFFKFRKKLFIVFLASLIFVYFALNTFIASIKYRVDSFNNMLDASSYTILTVKDNPLHFDEIDEIINSYDDLHSLLLINCDDEKPWTVGFMSKNYRSWFIKSEGRYFTNEEENEGLNVVMPVYDLISIDKIISDNTWKDIHEIQYQISNTNYTIVGTIAQWMLLNDVKIYYDSTDSNVGAQPFSPIKLEIVPYKNFIKRGFEIDAIKIGFNNKTKISLEDVKNALQKVNGNLTVLSPVKYEQTHSRDVISVIILNFILLFLCIVNIIALFSYWLHLNRKEFALMVICGATSCNIMLQMVLGLALMNVISLAIACILQWVAMPLFEAFKLNTNLSILELLGIFTAISILSFLLLIKQMLNISNSSNALKNKGD